jgi:hypothetical protein
VYEAIISAGSPLQPCKKINKKNKIERAHFMYTTPEKIRKKTPSNKINNINECI